MLLAHLCLTRTPFGRQVYAVGADLEAARKAGINTGAVLFARVCDLRPVRGGGGIVALSQAPAVSPTFRQQSEFMAIAAAVLGGTSLFGGRRRGVPRHRAGRGADPNRRERPEHSECQSVPLSAHHQRRDFWRPAGRLRSRVLARVNRRRIFIERPPSIRFLVSLQFCPNS